MDSRGRALRGVPEKFLDLPYSVSFTRGVDDAAKREEREVVVVKGAEPTVAHTARYHKARRLATGVALVEFAVLTVLFKWILPERPGLRLTEEARKHNAYVGICFCVATALSINLSVLTVRKKSGPLETVSVLVGTAALSHFLDHWQVLPMVETSFHRPFPAQLMVEWLSLGPLLALLVGGFESNFRYVSQNYFAMKGSLGLSAVFILKPLPLFVAVPLLLGAILLYCNFFRACVRNYLAIKKRLQQQTHSKSSVEDPYEAEQNNLQLEALRIGGGLIRYATLAWTTPIIVFVLGQVFNLMSPETEIILCMWFDVLSKVLFVNYMNEAHTGVLSQELHLKLALLAQNQATANRRAFLRYIMHEIRGPLNLISLSLDDLENTETVNAIQLSSDLLNNIVDETLCLSQIESNSYDPKIAEFNVSEAVSGLLSALRPLTKDKAIELTMNVLVDSDAVYETSRFYLDVVLKNFLTNACKFCPAGGEIYVVASEMPSSCQKKKDCRLRFDVCDEGCGISQEDLSKLFQPYSQIRPGELQGGRGTGLGLSICRNFVASVSGFIGAASQPAVGSRFFFELPARRIVSDKKPHQVIPVVPGGVQRAGSLRDSWRGLRVLVVDDVALNRNFLKKKLEKFGAVCETASDGADAVDKAGDRPFDVIMMDFVMPNMDGPSATKALRDRGYSGLIFGSTGNCLDTDIRLFIDAGAQHVLCKPLTDDKLLTVIKNHAPVPVVSRATFG